MTNPIYVTKPFLPPKEAILSYIDEIFKSGRLTNHGPFVRQLEEKLRDYLGVKNLILVANGTLALQLAYRALNLNGHAITTPFSFVATTSSLVWERIKPIYADIDPKRLTIDPTNVKKAITPRTRGIVPVHVFGNPCDIENIEEIATSNNLRVIYDAAHAFGVRYKGRSVLNYGDISTISFHATKLFHTIEGGAIITSNTEIAQKIRRMIDFGITDIDKVEGLGINAKMNEFEAVMGLSVLESVNDILENRRKLWSEYYDLLAGHVQFPELAPYTDWNYSYVPVLFKDESQLLKVRERLNQNNFYPRRYFYPSLNTLSYVNNKRSCPVSRNVSGRILCLPTYFGLEDEVVKKIAKVIKEGIAK